MAVLFLAKILK